LESNSNVGSSSIYRQLIVPCASVSLRKEQHGRTTFPKVSAIEAFSGQPVIGRVVCGRMFVVGLSRETFVPARATIRTLYVLEA